ncbi:MAG: hypothetical protein UR66_C0006G0067 [Candidatus Moranbacteria bacterium GW2011_GWE1_35_17]|nr:MAG: hypothetical protein UR66_C0006G0067 [Candidatus Moranbacteria bacterium GW2011_GWE1_35_17]KKP82133.1 MAG: hypothetical protein UR82_C0043G0004 [Candidatus Moranbacteria bacterium GW2011_GWF1_35_5]
MKKEYWWKCLVFISSGLFVGSGIIYDVYFCFSKYNSDCLFVSYRDSIIEPLFIFSVALFIVSVFLFLIKDTIFIKWLKFAIGWAVVSLFFISATPVYPGGFLDPDREQVSIWMSSLFLIISLILIVIWQVKEKRISK